MSKVLGLIPGPIWERNLSFWVCKCEFIYSTGDSLDQDQTIVVAVWHFIYLDFAQ